MQFIEFPMHLEEGCVVQLAELLKMIPNNNWSWRVLDFDGMGILSINMSMEEFEERVRSTPTGYRLSWRELKIFAEKLEQTWDCLIVAVESESDLVAEELSTDNFDRCLVVLRAFDSTSWSVSARDMQLLKKFTKFSNLDQYSGMSNSRGTLLQRGPARPLE